MILGESLLLVRQARLDFAARDRKVRSGLGFLGRLTLQLTAGASCFSGRMQWQRSRLHGARQPVPPVCWRVIDRVPSPCAVDLYSDFIVYVDEAGDHGAVSREFPVFVLAFCIFRKKEYASWVIPAVHEFKFRHLGHDAVVLHEREIRKAVAPFNFLRVPESARRSSST